VARSVELAERTLRALRRMASAHGLSVEALAADILANAFPKGQAFEVALAESAEQNRELLRRLAFGAASEYVLKKNAELYQRLSDTAQVEPPA
jgi:plasmid stability protein